MKQKHYLVLTMLVLTCEILVRILNFILLWKLKPIGESTEKVHI